MRRRGNILFLILLAVILFAALSYAVTSSMRGGSKDASSETAEMQAAHFLQWFANLDTAIMRMDMIGGYAFDKISFAYSARLDNGSAVNLYQNNVNCTSSACRLFHPDGGNVAPPVFPQYAVPPPGNTASLSPGQLLILLAKWPGAGTDANDIVFRFHGMKKSTCDKINATLGTTFVGTTGSNISGVVPDNWDSPDYITFTGNTDQLLTKTTAMINNGGSCNIYRLVFAR